MRSRFLLLAALTACGSSTTSPGSVKIVHDGNAAARVGARYDYNSIGRINFTGEPAGKYWYASCGGAVVDHVSGSVTFEPTVAGDVELCVQMREEARGASDGDLDEYRFTVKVTAREGDSDADRVAAGAAYAEKLLALGAQVATAKSSATIGCPTTIAAQTIYVYEREFLTWLRKHAPGTRFGDAASYYYSPWRASASEHLAQALDGRLGVYDHDQMVEKYRALIAKPYAAILTTTKVRSPSLNLFASSYVGGEWTGVLTIGELATGHVICQTPFTYRSSASVVTDGRTENSPKAAQDATRRDFEDNGRKAATAALTTISPTLRLAFVDETGTLQGDPDRRR